MFAHVEGGVCFTCDGTGLVLIETDPRYHYKARASKAAARIVDNAAHIAQMTGYEDFYNYVCRRLNIEIQRDKAVLLEVVEFCGDDFVNDLFIKFSDAA